MDFTGHRIVTVTDLTVAASLIDLDTGRQTAGGTLMKDDVSGVDGHLDRHLVSDHGRLSVIGYSATRITFTELSPTGDIMPAAQLALTPNGKEVVSELKDGTKLQLRTADRGNRLLAESARDTPVWPSGHEDYLRANRDGTLLADRQGVNIVSIRELPSLRERARIVVPTPPPETGDPRGALRYFFSDTSLITQSGTRIDEWDPTTGRRLGGFDASALHPRGSEGVEEFQVGSYPGPHQVTVLVQGDPRDHIVNLRTGAVTAGVRVPADAIATQFDPSGDHFMLLRHGSIPELWQRHPLRREVGPLPSVDAPPWTERFLNDGRFLLASNGIIQIYRFGDGIRRDTYNPGLDADDHEYTFSDAAVDGRTVLIWDGDIGQPLKLDPAAWRRDLCKIIGYRDFTPAERSASLVRIPSGPVCG